MFSSGTNPTTFGFFDTRSIISQNQRQNHVLDLPVPVICSILDRQSAPLSLLCAIPNVPKPVIETGPSPAYTADDASIINAISRFIYVILL